MRVHLVAALLCALAAGCSRVPFKRERPPVKPFVPPPPVVRTMPDTPLIVGDPPPNPGLVADIASIPFPMFASTTIELPERPRVERPRTRPTVNPAPPPEQPAEPTPPPVPVPKLTQILTEAESRRYRTELDRSARAAEQIVDTAARRQLNASQADMANRVRTLLRQASEQRDADLVAARNLARRAEILARDLQRTLR